MPAKGQSAKAKERIPKALEFAIAGASYRQIGRELGVSHQTAYRYVQGALGELDALKVQCAERLRELELKRLDRATLAVWPQVRAGDTQAIRAYVAISERRSKLAGIDAPERHQVVGMVITGEQLAGSRSSLDEKLEQLRQRMLGTGQDVIDAEKVDHNQPMLASVDKQAG